MTFPALTERRRTRFSALVALYVGQGVPLGLLVVAAPAYLVERGADAAAVGGYSGLVLLPFALKVLVGPVMDRFAFLPMGRRRPWVLAGGLGVIAGFAALAVLGDHGLAAVTACGIAVTSAIAVLDTAVDGMAVDVLEETEQGRANALMWGGSVLGLAASAVGTSRLLEAGGFALAAGVVAGVQAGLLAVPLLVRERPGERLLPWTAGAPSAVALDRQPDGWRAVFGRLRRNTLLPASLLLLVVAVCAGALDGLLIAYMPALTVGELGWDDTGWADLVAVGQVAAGVIGMGLGAVLIGRVGKVRMLVGLAALVAVVIGAMAAAPALWPVRATLVAFAFGYLVPFVLLTITILATGMALCSPAVAATQFALFTTAMNLGRSAGGGLLGALSGFGPSAPFVVAAVLGGVVVVLGSRIDVEAHRARLTAPPHDRAASAVEPVP